MHHATWVLAAFGRDDGWPAARYLVAGTHWQSPTRARERSRLGSRVCSRARARSIAGLAAGAALAGFALLLSFPQLSELPATATHS